VSDVVRRQVNAGPDIVNDGEFGKPTDTTNDADHVRPMREWSLSVAYRRFSTKGQLEGTRLATDRLWT
jgi:hypothetical protein